MNTQTDTRIPLSLVVAAVLAAGMPAQASADEEITALTRPTSTVAVGAAHVSEDNSRFGQYRGLTNEGVYGVVDAEIVDRDDATGTWVILRGRNLGLDSRDLRFEHQRQGNWGYHIEYDQTPRDEPFRLNTGLGGIGTNNLTVNTIGAGTGGNGALDTQRQAIGLGGRKELPGGFAFEFKFRNEEKNGERLFASGNTGGPGQFDFLAEPIDSTTRQWEAILSYTGKALQLAAGYYGTHYDNAHPALNVAGGNVGFTPIALPPDNQSHQGYLSGSYKFTPTTVGNFKLAYGRITQHDPFITPSTPGDPDLDGRVDTTQVALGLSARPYSRLSLRANLRYDDRDDKTPLRDYFPGGGVNPQNEPRSVRTTGGKVEASYLLPMDFRITGSVDYVEKKRNASPLRIVSHRDTTEELTYRAELRRGLSATLNGSLALIHSTRDGSPFLVDGHVSDTALVAPLHLADRDRNQVRLMLDWTPLQPLSLQFIASASNDDYRQRAGGADALGLTDGRARHFTVDATYVFSPDLQATAWYSYDFHEATQRSRDGIPRGSAVGGTNWTAQLGDTGNAVGLGLRGRPTQKLELGADLQHTRYRSEFDQVSSDPADPAPAIPDVTYRTTTLSLFAKYQLQKNAGMRIDFTHERLKTNDWQWANFVYSDGTTLTEEPRQSVNYAVLSYYYSFH